MMSIACSTDGAEIHYTLNGDEPKLSSTLYLEPIQLTKNCIVKAVAFKDGKNSETAEHEEIRFVVDNPVVTVSEDDVTVTISCTTPGATIFYTTDETSPLTSSTREQYADVLSVKSRCLLKVIATKDGYTNSETIERYVGPIVDYVVIDGNEAGKLKNNLEAKVGEDGITTVENLAVSGSLNGTDIAFIRDMINNYSLSALDIENTNIVSGGEPYYVPSYGTPDYTTDNVVGKNMFDQCEKIITLKLPYSITMIESYAFWNCKNLRELHIPASCITVKENAIYGCSNLESIYFGANVTNFDGNNCSGCNCLKGFYVNSENTIYKSTDGVLYNISNRTLVKYPMGLQNNDFSVPDDVEVIGNYAFEYANFTNITLPDGLTEIGSSAFADCRQLTTISIPSNVKAIGHMAFWGCSSLFSIDMPMELTEIKSYTFNRCVNLRELPIEKNVQKIDDNAFDYCTSLQKFIVNKDNVSYSSDNGILYTKDFKTLKRCR